MAEGRRDGALLLRVDFQINRYLRTIVKLAHSFHVALVAVMLRVIPRNRYSAGETGKRVAAIPG